MPPKHRESRRDTRVPSMEMVTSPPIGKRQLPQRGAIALIASVAVNLLILTLARSVMEVDPAFRPFSASRVVFLTVLGVATGLVIAVIMNRFAKKPVRTFRWTILLLLGLSFLPDIGLLRGDSLGVTVPAVASLMLMHLAAGAIFIGLIIVAPDWQRGGAVRRENKAPEH